VLYFREVEGRMSKFMGVNLSDTEIRYKSQRGPVAGAKASVESQPSRGWSLMTGFLGSRGHEYLTVEGDGFGFVVEVPRSLGLKARRFALEINQAAAASGSEVEYVQPDWHRDPYGRHEDRWWDGDQWTEFVRDGDGETAIDRV
jgi:hypothetical protein